MRGPGLINCSLTGSDMFGGECVVVVVVVVDVVVSSLTGKTQITFHDAGLSSQEPIGRADKIISGSPRLWHLSLFNCLLGNKGTVSG